MQDGQGKTDSKENKEAMVEVKAKVLEEVLDKTKVGGEELDKATVLDEEKGKLFIKTYVRVKFVTNSMSAGITRMYILSFFAS